MKKYFYAAFLVMLALASSSFGQEKTFFQKIAGNWAGTLEYQDYSTGRRVKLKTYLTVIPAADGSSAEFLTVYDDITKLVKDTETVKIDLFARKYVAGNSEYSIDSIVAGKIILFGSGQDGEKIEPIRKTISYNENSLEILKETRTPWQFRNRLILKRTEKAFIPTVK